MEQSRESTRAHSDALTAADTHRLLKRAAELDRAPGRSDEPSLEFAEVRRIAVESGLSHEAIERAFRELRIGALGPKPKPSLQERLFGPESVACERELDLPPDEARRKLHALLEGELLRIEESQGVRAVWGPAPGLLAALRRGIDWSGESAWQESSLISEVIAAPPGTSAPSKARLEAKSTRRGGRLAAIVTPAVFLVMAGLVGLDPVALHQGAPVAIGVTGLLSGGAITLGVRHATRKRIRGLRRAMGGVLEKLGSHREAAPARDATD